GEAVPQPAGFTLLALTANVFLNSVAPNEIPTSITDTLDASANPVEVVIDGTGFHDVASVELVTNTGLVAATAAQITVESSERIRARIDPQLVPGKAFEYLPGMPSFQGPLSVRVTNRNGTVGLLENAIQAVGEVGVFGSATAQFLRTNLVVPGVLYPN